MVDIPNRLPLRFRLTGRPWPTPETAEARGPDARCSASR